MAIMGFLGGDGVSLHLGWAVEGESHVESEQRTAHELKETPPFRASTV